MSRHLSTAGLVACLVGAAGAGSLFGQARWRSPILGAAARGDLTTLRQLLPEGQAVGPQLAVRSRNGWTPLHHAARSRRAAAVRLLLDRGAATDARSRRGATALHVAVQRGDAATVALLVERGVELDATDRDGRTALMLARRAVDVKLLLQHGADPNVADRRGLTMLHHYAQDSYWSGGERLRLAVASGLSVDARDRRGQTPLFWSCTRRYARKIAVLAQLEADPRLARRDGATPLHQLLAGNVCRYTCDDVLALLEQLQALGASIDAQDRRGQTPLHVAARWGNHRALRRLLQLGAKVEARDRSGRTAAEVCQRSRRHSNQKACLEALRRR